MSEHIHISEFSNKMQRYIELTANASYDHIGAASAKIAALVLYKNRPICIGYNSHTTHPLQKKYGKNEHAICVHAEIDAIQKACFHIDREDFNKLTMIVMRSKKNKEWGLAKPCLHHGSGCQAALKAFNIKNVYYSTDETGYLEKL